MQCVTVYTVLVALIGVTYLASAAQYLNNRPYPTYSLEHMPDTEFSCRDKVLGGYYADAEAKCQMFHICVKVAGLGVQDFRFLCPNGTAFDQDNQICAEWDDVDCEAATLYYSSDNFDLYRLGSGFESAAFPGEDEGTFHLQSSDTGDARLSREHQVQKVNQQTNYNTVTPLKRPTPTYNRDRDILRGSSSSNFFNNRNGGKESDEDDYDANAPSVANQNAEIPRKKIIRKLSSRKPVEDYETQTQRTRPTGFVNNFAGSSYNPTTVRTTTEQYASTNNLRARQNGRNRGGDYRNNDEQYIQSTPAPFKQPEVKQYKNINRQTNYENPTTVVYNQYDNKRVKQQQQYNTKETENYPTTAPAKQFQNSKYPVKETENYPTTAPARQFQSKYPTKETENYPTTAPARNANQYQNRETENYPSTPLIKQTENYPSTAAPFRKTENYPTTPEKQYEIQKKPTTFKQTENYPTTYSPSSKQTQYYQPKETENYPSTNNQYNTQFTNDYVRNQQFQTSTTTTIKPPLTTTQHTQYTPTVPKQTTQYYQTTTPSTTRFSKQFDETSYDDGSYSDKYEGEASSYKNEDEFLKTAHSQNYGSGRNDFVSSSSSSHAPTTQSPRPFSVTTPLPRGTPPSRVTQNVPKTTQQNKPTVNAEVKKSSTKKSKDVSYDYAYYDTNIGNEPDYDIGTEFQKSTKTAN